MSRANTKEKLAVLGGPRTIPEGKTKPWPPIEEIDKKMVVASLEAGKHTYGPNSKAFEDEFGAWLGHDKVLLCGSGTAALHMALVACEVGPGDEVIVPAYTWPSSATCCLHHNAIPVFVDIDWDTINLDTSKIEAAITPRTKAIMVVHLHGLMVNMDEVADVAQRHHLKVVEDCCQGHGATFQGKKAGTFGDAAGFSLNQNKCLTSGEGGFFVAKDKTAFDRGKTLWYFGEHRPPDAEEGYHAYGMGWMYRSSDLAAAFGRAQLTRFDQFLQRQKENAERLTECLQDVPSLILPTVPEGHTHNYYNYTIRFDMKALGHQEDPKPFRDAIVRALKSEGVETGIWQGWPLPEMTVFQARDGYGKGCPWSCRYASQVNYDLAQFPVAKKHSDWHTGMTTPLRYPNDPELAELVAQAFIKVIDQADALEALMEQGP